MVSEHLDQSHEQAPVGVVLVDSASDTHQIVDANTRFGEQTGYDPAAVIGREYPFFQGEETRSEQVEAVHRALDRSSTERVDLRGYRKDGTEFWCRIHVGEDSTDEEYRLCIQDELTALYKQQHQLKRRNERLASFARTVSHDLRNPLNIAMTRVELARQTRDLDQLADATAALERIEQLIETTFESATGSAGPQRTVSLPAVIEQAWDTVETADATLEIGVDTRILANESRLQQLFENLFDNAVTHGGSAVSVRVGGLDPIATATRDNGDAFAGFFVADDGSGFPAPLLDAGTVPDNPGTSEGSYGLQIVTRIVEEHNWQLSLGESERGGARIVIEGVETPP